MLAEETAAAVVCGLDRVLSGLNELTSDWNAIEGKADPEYAVFIERCRGVLELV